MAETWSERARRLKKDRKRQRSLTGPARRKLKRKLRKERYAARKRVFGPCPTCGRAGGPGHTCNMRFSERNSQRLRDRMDKRQQPENPDLWRGRRAA
jgi:hypothetical protein